jgi:hypothetical protein
MIRSHGRHRRPHARRGYRVLTVAALAIASLFTGGSAEAATTSQGAQQAVLRALAYAPCASWPRLLSSPVLGLTAGEQRSLTGLCRWSRADALFTARLWVAS